MKKLLSFALAAVMALSLMACSSDNDGATDNLAGGDSSQSDAQLQNNGAGESITISSYNANNELSNLEVPYDPQRIVILDMASLDILDALGVGDRVVGTASTELDYLQSYINDDITNVFADESPIVLILSFPDPDVNFSMYTLEYPLRFILHETD